MNFGMDDICVGVAWNEDDSEVYAACVNNNIYSLNLDTKYVKIIGSHEQPVRDVQWISTLGLLASISYDSTLKFWDPMNPNTTKASYKLPSQPMCFGFRKKTMLIAFKNNKIALLNLEKLSNVEAGLADIKDSPLGDAIITLVDLTIDGDGFAIASHCGRANLSKISFSNIGHDGKHTITNIMTFKGQKSDNGGK
jgi:WD40 repeat protein